MTTRLLIFLAFMISLTLAQNAQAGPEAFSTGPAIKEFGPVADIAGADPLPEGVSFRLSYDTASEAADGALNKTLVTAARFINMHVRAGVAPENINLAVVVHGKAVRDVSKQSGGKDGAVNRHAELIAALTKHNVRIIVCGQSAAYYDVAAEDLLENVEMSLSAMTAHVLLQNDGYAMNPF